MHEALMKPFWQIKKKYVEEWKGDRTKVKVWTRERCVIADDYIVAKLNENGHLSQVINEKEINTGKLQQWTRQRR